ncbi:MAG: radical SAM protein [Kiritimatiellia bacterium]|nr:radical SAM protein [Kiritimatiellia bacterium]
MKVLFIYPTPPAEHIPAGYNFGIGYCSAVLKTGGHQTDLLITDRPDKNTIRQKIASFQPDLIGISATTDQFALAKLIVKIINDNYTVPIIIGGVHATVAPDDAINTPGIFGICVGEGEAALLELANALENGGETRNIQNLWLKSGNDIIKNPVRPLLQELDQLPFCDREIFNYNRLMASTSDGAEFIAGRGCPFSCSFCINAVLQNLYKNKGKYVRLRSADNLLKEIRHINEKYKIKIITFHDDTFSLNRAWLADFCLKYSREFKIPFRCNARADNIDEELLGQLKEAGCEQLWVGVESGDEHLRNTVLKKQVRRETIVAAFRLIKKYGIKSRAFNMIGVPYETRATAEKTIELNREINADLKCLTVFRPYPGTELYDLCKSKGWISNRQIHGYYEDSILNQPSITGEDVYFYHKIYFYAMYAPFLVPFLRWLHGIRIFRRSLFCILQPKWLFYFLHNLAGKIMPLAAVIALTQPAG